MSGSILSIGYLQGPEDLQKPVKHVIYLQGNFDYFDMNHLLFAILALVVGICFVLIPTFVLLLYPLV